MPMVRTPGYNLLIDIGNTFLKWGLFRTPSAGGARENRLESGHVLLEEMPGLPAQFAKFRAPAQIVISALRKLGPDANAEQIRNYIANLHGFVGVNGPYDFRAVPQRGIDVHNVYIVRWDPAGDRFAAASRGGGIPVQ